MAAKNSTVEERRGALLQFFPTQSWVSPNRTSVDRRFCRVRARPPTSHAVFDPCANKADEQWVSRVRLALELRMELAPDEVWMIGELNHLNEVTIRRDTRKHQACTLKSITVVVVDLEAMAVPLADVFRTVDLRCERTGLECARIRTKPHCRTLVLNVSLVRHDVDHEVRRIRVELGAVGVLKPAHVARVLDDSHLHPKTDAKERNVVLACVLNRPNLAFATPSAKTTWH